MFASHLGDDRSLVLGLAVVDHVLHVDEVHVLGMGDHAMGQKGLYEEKSRKEECDEFMFLLIKLLIVIVVILNTWMTTSLERMMLSVCL